MTCRTTPRARSLVVLVLAACIALAAACSGSEPEQAAPFDGSELHPGTTATRPPTTTTTITTTTVPTATTTVVPPPTTIPGAMAIPPSALGAPLVHKVQTADPVVFVTIDDGTTASPEGLQYLKDTGMPVSMFLNRGPVEAHRAYFEVLISMGNWVHSHTLDHPRLPHLDPADQAAQICGMRELLLDAYGPTGKVGGFVRAPYGMTDGATGPAAASCGIAAMVGWSGEVRDGALFMVNPHLYPGDVILLHFTPDLLADLATIKAAADEAGLTIARLEDYLVAPGPPVPAPAPTTPAPVAPVPTVPPEPWAALPAQTPQTLPPPVP